MPRTLPVAALAVVLLLSGCAVGPADAPSESAPVATSDARQPDGVTELAAPALHLTTLTPDGTIVHLDVASGRSSTIAHIAPAAAVVGDGRYLFALWEGSVTIVDSGAWTWNHGDHVHYYSGPARVVGDVEGPGTPSVVPGERSVGVRFDGDGDRGEAVLIKVGPLADGEIEELFRRESDGGEGMVVPLAYGAWVTEAAGGRIARLRHVDEEGAAGDAVRCADAGGSIATVVGVVVACADDVVLAADGRPAKAERLAYPDVDDRVRAFSGREGRPSVAALTDGGAVWVLDTRARLALPAGVSYTWRGVVRGQDGDALLLGSDGRVHIVDPASGEVTASHDAIDAWESPVEWQDEHPAIAVAGGTAYVTDAAQRRIVALDAATGAVTAAADLPVTPNEIVALD